MTTRPTATPYARQARRIEATLLALVLLVMLLGGALALLAKRHTLLAPDAGGRPPAFVNLNTATAAEIARALGTEPAVGERVVAARTLRGEEGFPDVDSLRRISVVPRGRAEEVAAKLRGVAAGADAKNAVLALEGLSREERNRLIELRSAYPDDDWPRVLRYPLLPAAQVNGASDRLIVRPWDEARLSLLTWLAGMAAFFALTHLALRLTRPGADPFLLPVTAALSALGVLLLWGIKDPLRDQPTYLWQAQGVVIGGALALLFALSRPLARLPLHRYGYSYAIAAIAGTVLLGVLGTGPGGVRLTVFGTQPVEIIKILMVFFLAAYLAERGPLLNDPLRKFGPFSVPRPKDVLPLLVLYALPLALFSIVRDLGPVLLLFGAFLLLVYLATARGVYVVLGLLALLAGGWVGYLLKFGVFETRVDMWLSPWNNGHTSGDHLALGLWGLASGGPAGSGLGLGGSRYIPRSGSDLAFASLGEEMGPLACLAVIACFLLIAARGQAIARRSGSDFDRLLASGLSCLLAVQALIITAGTLGILPLTGITLPFVSNGKSSLVASYLIIGILLALSAKAPAQTPAALPLRSFLVASRRLAAGLTLLFAVCAGRLLWVQTIGANAIATRVVRVPDSDGVKRADINPRLVRAMAERIPRGRLLDRAGRVVAFTRAADGKRVYPYGESLAHLLGYADPAIGGPTGLEQRFGAELRGFKTYSALLPYWRAKDLPGFRLPKGQDVVLSVDAELQKAALEALRRHTAGLSDRRNGLPKRRGAVVVLDATTGEILAAATSPTYDPNVLTPRRMQTLRANLDNEFPLINRASGGYYPPGSTFKIVTASAQFANSLSGFTKYCAHVDHRVRWEVNGTNYARRRVVDDEGERPHGETNLAEAVEESCNVYFAGAGIALGPAALRTHAERYGFARLPTVRAFAESLPDLAYGQSEMLASPLEMATVAATVANGGKRLVPQYVKGAAPKVADTPMSPQDAATLGEMMRLVTVSGTAAGRFDGLPYPVAGKTGTAQNDQYDRIAHSWFIGFAAPAGRPPVAFAVIVENGGYGSQRAVPVSRDVLGALR